MKFTIITTVLLGLLLTPALAGGFHADLRKKIPVPGGHQTLSLDKEWHVAVVEQKTTQGAWKVVFNYDKGVIATKVLPEKVCYISRMDRRELPAFKDLPELTEQYLNSTDQKPALKNITFIARRRIRDLASYGPIIFSTCRGLKTFVVHRDEGQHDAKTQSPGSCLAVDILYWELRYCRDETKAKKSDHA